MAIDCGRIPPTIVSLGGAGGSALPLFVTGTNPDTGGTAGQIIDMTTESGDYVPDGISADGSFLILIESAAPIEVQLENDSNFTISTVYATTYLGDWIPMRIKTVYKSGSTGTFSVGF